MTSFNSEWIWLKPSSSPSCKLGAHGQAPLSFLLPRKTQGKPKDNPILRNTGFIISRCCVHHPETMEDKDAPSFSAFLPRKDTHTHTHTHMPGYRCRFKQSPKDICWTPTYPLHLATCSAGHLLVAFFCFLGSFFLVGFFSRISRPDGSRLTGSGSL